MELGRRRSLILVSCAALVLGLVIGAGGCHRRRAIIEDNQELYERAQQRIAERKFLRAIELLGDVGLREPVSEELDPLVKIALADAYFYQLGGVSVVEAQTRYEQFLSFYPTHPLASYARYMVGVALFDQAESPDNDQEFTKRALLHFEALVEDLPPDDPYLLPAKQMWLRAQNRLAEHEWQVAEFYLEREHYAGAIGRYSTLIEKYPGARRREEAFLQMARAHLAVGAPGQARLAIDRMLAEYDGGELAEEARTLLAQIDRQSDQG
jgi:outer membrane protein assembly factor BamD